MKAKPSEYSVVYVVSVFSKNDESLIGTYPIQGLSLQDLQRMFGVPPEDPMYDCWPIRASQVQQLQKAISREIDLANYDCFVEGYREDE